MAGTTRARTDPKRERSATRREHETFSTPRFFKMPIRPNLATDPARVKAVIFNVLEGVEEMRNFKRSRVTIEWKQASFQQI